MERSEEIKIEDNKVEINKMEEDNPSNEDKGEKGTEIKSIRKKKKKQITDDLLRKGLRTKSGDDKEEEISNIIEDIMDYTSMERRNKTSKSQLSKPENSIIQTSSRSNNDTEMPWIGTDRDYTYEELLTRIFNILYQHRPDLADIKPQTMVSPNVLREGTKKTVLANLEELCTRMRRKSDHFVQYLLSELGTNGSVGGDGRLIIKGRFQQKQVESVVRRYLLEYVVCKNCQTFETLITKTKKNRLNFINCEKCKATQSVSAIKTGYKAQLEKRSIIRMNQEK